jgi:hypothetical protein
VTDQASIDAAAARIRSEFRPPRRADEQCRRLASQAEPVVR